MLSTNQTSESLTNLYAELKNDLSNSEGLLRMAKIGYIPDKIKENAMHREEILEKILEKINPQQYIEKTKAKEIELKIDKNSVLKEGESLNIEKVAEEIMEIINKEREEIQCI